jgi:hypothetical protein
MVHGVDEMNPFPENTQKYRIMKHLMVWGKIEVWKLITPRPQGLGVAQYGTRIKEMREVLKPQGFEIRNVAGKYFEMRKIQQQESLI